MNSRTAGWVAMTVWAACVALSIAGVALAFPDRSVAQLNTPQQWGSAFLSICFGTVGALVAARRPRNSIGWIFLVIALSQGLSTFGVYGESMLLHREHITLASWLQWAETWTWLPGFVFVPTLLLQLFPDGKPLSPKWRKLAVITIGGMVPALAGLMFSPKSKTDVVAGYRSPVPTSGVLLAVLGAVALVFFGVLVASVGSIIQRYRRSRGEEREQLKWFVYAAVATVVLFTGGNFAAPDTGPPSLVLGVLIFLSIPLIPVATAVAIFRYRLYDIDVVINRTVVFGALAAFITALYVAIVVGIGAALGSTSNRFLPVVAAVLIAVAFQPARERARRFANRLVFGKRATPYEVLAEFSERMATTYAAEDVLPRMARILAEGTGASGSEVWLRTGSELRRAASWPDGAPSAPPVVLRGEEPTIEGTDRSAPVIYQGELLGAVAITKPRAEPLTATEDKLMRDLASQAGLVLRNVQLIEDLRASRQRIVAAQDEERRRLERNIHDGAQQQLVALNVKLGLLKTLAAKDAAQTAKLAEDLQNETAQALEDLRDLARGIYPPLLADQGLVAALQAQARKAAVPVEVAPDGVGRYPQEVEAAVYFCTLEALQNVAKYAGAARALVSLSATNGSLVFSIADDGHGFDPDSTPMGTGLQGMADRLAALGGSVEVRSSPGAGTTVVGSIPVA